MTTASRVNMKRSRIVRIALPALACVAMCMPAAAARQEAANVGADRAAIRGVVDAFRRAIIAKDRAALERLPLSDSITFAAAVETTTLAENRRKRSAAKRWQQDSYAAFVESIVTAKPRQEEVFSNIRVRNDDAVADVYFDYAFKEDGVVTNTGHESWGLVRTDDGWKIASIIYSVKLPPSRE